MSKMCPQCEVGYSDQDCDFCVVCDYPLWPIPKGVEPMDVVKAIQGSLPDVDSVMAEVVAILEGR